MAKILVIDDDDTIRTLLCRMLERSGHDVLVAANGTEASELFRKNPLDLIITDLFMPDREGLEIIQELRKNHPQVKIIAISGGGSIGGTSFLDVARLIGASRTLEKPFGSQTLLGTVDEVLGLGEEA